MPVALVLGLAGTATAEKPKLAVLGLEVVGSIDTGSTMHGRLLTERFRATIGTSARYASAPNSMKDLLDEKVANGCDNEAPDCMATIGSKLKAGFVMYGKIEKRPKDGKEGYQLSMKFLDVEKKTVKEWGDWVPLGEFVEAGALDGRVATAFDTLSREPGDTVITGPGPGIGFTEKPTSPLRHGFPWKPTAVVTSAVALVAFGGFIYYGPIKTGQYNKDCKLIPGMADIDNPGSYIGDLKHQEDCASNGPKFDSRNKIAGIAAAAVGGIALFAIYKGFIAKQETSTQTTSGRSTKKKKKQFAVTPIVSPEGGGATFRLDW